MSAHDSGPGCTVCGTRAQPLYQAPRDVTDRYPFQGFRLTGRDREQRWYCQEHRPNSFEILDESEASQ